ncbi:unnamed protein product [Toxocara canis]|uniref:Uncharacterized protein n=1 Tax=Toxocara canis TaxID=6265 RepID=A0A183U5M5_TOXCA|nr:unnamed protein product [Toxocara canis]
MAVDLRQQAIPLVGFLPLFAVLSMCDEIAKEVC